MRLIFINLNKLKDDEGVFYELINRIKLPFV